MREVARYILSTIMGSFVLIFLLVSVVVFEQGATDESPAHDNHNLRDQLEIHDHQTQHSQHDNSFVRGIGDDSCIWMPNRTQCSDYKFPPLMAEADIVSLCGQMPNMGGCSVDGICKKSLSSSVTGSPYCIPFSLLKGICNGDMSPMKGCANFTSMCFPEDSLVKECAMEVRSSLFFRMRT